MDPLETVRRLGSGQFVENLEEALASVCLEVLRTRQPGQVTVTFVIAPEPGDIAVTIKESIKRAMPKEPTQGAYLFFYEGDFHRNDPRQVEMELRIVSTQEAERRQVDDETGEIKSVEA